ncbi:hypothetical protein FJQ54_07175 [Sandaracinobacter neustonicus]|uniref:Uncharacterized protein n=1 Tax=Sandaracinobacter neustonicus TaxID=1715348 RepID=A0A501XPA7_9SPHN|nr:hypothetical protein [Sandaracinobacter neustonicus]TPE62299.1 hypothetical protein FJQ54_07175 [Sandaracinobacter neustonicus]
MGAISMSVEFREMSAGLSADISGERDSLRNFVAIQDVPPQKTLFISVTGSVLVSNPGIDVTLNYTEPQGINSKILILEIDFLQRPGMWPQMLRWKTVSYVQMIHEYGQYESVYIRNGNGLSIEVTDRS